MITKDDLEVMDPEGMVEDPDHLRMSVQARRIAQHVMEVLCNYFLGWKWGVTVDEKGGVVYIFALELSGDMGYTLLYDDVYNGGNYDRNMILMAGGEILERYGCPRGPKTPDWHNHVTWHHGTAIPDISDKQKGLRRLFAKRAALLDVPIPPGGAVPKNPFLKVN